MGGDDGYGYLPQRPPVIALFMLHPPMIMINTADSNQVGVTRWAFSEPYVRYG